MNHRQRAVRSRHAKRLTFVRPRLEELECRLTPSFSPGATLSLELVALHEFGHALGLPHISPQMSIMNPDYNPDYSIDSFLSGEDPAVSLLQQLYTGDNIAAGISPWRDLQDGNPGNNTIDLTYSFAGGEPSFAAMMNERFGDPGAWQPIFTRVADYWSAASGGTVIINFADDESLPAGFRGNIRLGAMSLDGEGGVLAVGAEPPSGEITFDADEPWNGGGLKLQFLDDAVSDFGGDPGDGGDDEHLELRVSVINMPRQFIAMHEASFDLQTVTLFSNLNPARVIQVQVDPQTAVPPRPAPAFVANVGWGQHSQADLYKVVFLPVLPTDSAEEAAATMPDAVTPAQPSGNEARPDPAAPVRNDPSIQTQTPQLPQQQRQSSPDGEENEEAAAATAFDAGTALAGLALFMGGYWAVPQEEERKRFFN